MSKKPTDKVLQGYQGLYDEFNLLINPNNAGNFSGLPTSMRASYDSRYEKLLKLQHRLQRFILSEGQIGTGEAIKRELLAVGITDPDHYVKYGLWQDPISYLESHHGGGGLKVQQQLSHLPPAKHYEVLAKLAEREQFPGQPKGKNLWSLTQPAHRGNPGGGSLDPWVWGSRLRSAHGHEGTFNPININPNSSVDEIVEQVSSAMAQYDETNLITSKGQQYFMETLKDLPEDQVREILEMAKEDPTLLDRLYKAGGGEREVKWIGRGSDRLVAHVKTSENPVGKVYEWIKGKGKQAGQFNLLTKAGAATLIGAGFNTFPGQVSAQELKDHGIWSPEFIGNYTGEQVLGKGGAFATAKALTNKGAQRFLKGAALKIGGRLGLKGANYAAAGMTGPAAPWIMGGLAVKDIWDVTNILTDDVPNKALEAGYNQTLGRIKPVQEIPESYGSTRTEMSNTATPMTAETRPLTGVEKVLTNPLNEIKWGYKQLLDLTKQFQ